MMMYFCKLPKTFKKNLDKDSHVSHSDNALENIEEEYHEYARTDPIKKAKFNYVEHVALTRDDQTSVFDANKLTKKNCPAAANNFVYVAPGEGQIPVSVLKEKEWVLKLSLICIQVESAVCVLIGR